MSANLLLTIFTILTFQTFAQNEMETRCMKTIKEFSVEIHFPKFTGPTIISKDTIKFDSSAIIIHYTDPEIKKIFEIGLVFPDLIYGASTMGDKYEFKKTFGADTLSISSVTELHFANQRPDTKSFSFLLWQQNMANPRLYLFEMKNKTANTKTTFRDFVEKAKITAFEFCSILI
jgi:hypothetical protein